MMCLRRNKKVFEIYTCIEFELNMNFLYTPTKHLGFYKNKTTELCTKYYSV